MTTEKRDPPTTIWDIPRNDIEACRAYWLTGKATSDDLHTMMMLQDDPAELIVAMRDWPTSPGRSRGSPGR